MATKDMKEVSAAQPSPPPSQQPPTLVEAWQTSIAAYKERLKVWQDTVARCSAPHSGRKRKRKHVSDWSLLKPSLVLRFHSLSEPIKPESTKAAADGRLPLPEPPKLSESETAAVNKFLTWQHRMERWMCQHSDLNVLTPEMVFATHMVRSKLFNAATAGGHISDSDTETESDHEDRKESGTASSRLETAGAKGSADAPSASAAAAAAPPRGDDHVRDFDSQTGLFFGSQPRE
jgi:hypothetical protein